MTAISAGSMTLRRALEQSKNLVTARLLDGGIDKDPTKSLEQICELALEARIYPECMKNYPFVLGAQALRMIDLAGFYAAIANEGAARHALCHRRDRTERPAGLSARRRHAGDHGRRRPRRVLSASHHPRRRGDARHGGLDEAPHRLRRRQDRHHRQRKRRLVRRLHQRRHRRGLGRLRQCPRQADAWAAAAPAASSRCRSSSRSSRPPGIIHAPKSPLPPPSPEAAVTSRRCRSTSTVDKSWHRPKTAFHRIFPARRQRQAARHPACPGRTASAGVPRSDARPRRGRRPAARYPECYGHPARSNATGCRAHCGNCSGFDVNRSDAQSRPRSYGQCQCRERRRVGVTAMWIKSCDVPRCWCLRPRRLRQRAGLPDREGGFGRRRRHRLAQAEDHLLQRSPRRRNLRQGRLHPVR